MKKLVAEGMGIGCIPREYMQPEAGDNSIFEIEVSPTMPSRSVGVALPKNTSISYALRAFLELFREG